MKSQNRAKTNCLGAGVPYRCRDLILLDPNYKIRDMDPNTGAEIQLKIMREVSKTPLNLTQIISFIPELLTALKTPLYLTN